MLSGAAAEKAAVDDMVRARVHRREETWNFIGVGAKERGLERDFGSD